MEPDPDMTCSALVSQATHLCECTCSTCSISSSDRVPIAGGHAATKHQLHKTSGSLLVYTLLLLYLALLDSPQLYYTLSLLYLPLLDSTWLYYTLLCLCLALLDSTLLHYIVPWLYLVLLDPTWLYYTLPWLYLALLESTTPIMVLLGSAWRYLTLLHSTTALLNSTWL